MNNSPTPVTDRNVVLLAAVADVALPSAKKALLLGHHSVRGRAGARLAEALIKLHMHSAVEGEIAKTTSPTPATDRNVVLLAAAADVVIESAEKALLLGPHSVRGRAGARLAEAMTELHMHSAVEAG